MTEHSWGLHHGSALVARLRNRRRHAVDVRGDRRVARLRVGALVVRGQERAVASGDVERIGPAYHRIREAVTMTFPDGRPVPEFTLHIHADGTAHWRWHDAPFPARS